MQEKIKVSKIHFLEWHHAGAPKVHEVVVTRKKGSLKTILSLEDSTGRSIGFVESSMKEIAEIITALEKANEECAQEETRQVWEANKP